MRNKQRLFSQIAGRVIVPILLFGILASLFVFLVVARTLFLSASEGSLWLLRNQSVIISRDTELSKNRIKITAKYPELRAYLLDQDSEEKRVAANTILSIANASSRFEYISLIDSNGDVLNTETGQPTNLNVSYRQYFRDSLLGDTSVELIVGQITKELGLYIAHAVRTEQDEPVGVLVGKLSIQNYVGTIFSHLPNTFSNLLIVNESGVVLYSKNQEQIFRPLLPLSQAQLDEQNVLQEYPQFQNTSLNKAAQAQLLDSNEEGQSLVPDPEAPLFLQGVPVEQAGIYLIGERSVFPLLASSALPALGVAAFVFLSALASIMIIFSSLPRLFRPLKKLNQAMRAFQGGLPLPELELQAKNELGELSQIFTQLTTMVRQRAEGYSHTIDAQNQELSRQKMALVNVLEDVQAEKDQALSAINELRKFQLAVENVSDLIVITNAQGHVVYVNKQVEPITGYQPQEVIGKKAGVLWGRLMPDEYYKKMWEVISVQKKEFRSEIVNRRKNGEHFTAGISISPVIQETGEILFFVSVQRDITKEKEVDRLKNEFLSLASHQLRTPLSAMRWYLEMLLNGDAGKLSDEQSQMITLLSQSNQRMITLVSSLLNVSRLESGRLKIEPVPTDVAALLQEVITEMMPIATQKGIEIVRLHDTLPSVSLDPKLIREVYKNLISNAVKYSPANTKVVVTLKTDGDQLYSEVSDSGYGIPVSDQVRIFEKFYRGSNVQKMETEGTGLGLYLVQSVIRACGGKIKFQSEENHGTKFFFWLPLSGVKPSKGEVSLEPESVQPGTSRVQ